MEVILEISREEAEKLQISPSSKLTLEELKRKIAMQKMHKALEESHAAAKKYGIDTWTMDDINNLIKEAKEEYKKPDEKDCD
jgi:lipoate-protein ligase A